VASSIYATGTIEQNKWQHFAVTIDSAGQRGDLSKNGVQLLHRQRGVPTNITRTSNAIGKDAWASDSVLRLGTWMSSRSTTKR